MLYKDLKELKNDTTIKIYFESGRIEVTRFFKDLLLPEKHLSGAINLPPRYLYKGASIPLHRVQLATKEDIDLYILNKQRKLDQLERELKAGLCGGE